MADRRSRRAADQPSRLRWFLAAFATVIVGLVIVNWPRPAVELDGRGYQVAMALYRTCNQADPKALGQIEQMMDDWTAEEKTSSEQHQSIRQIIADAKQGHWEAAAQACRALLDAQAKR